MTKSAYALLAVLASSSIWIGYQLGLSRHWSAALFLFAIPGFLLLIMLAVCLRNRRKPVIQRETGGNPAFQNLTDFQEQLCESLAGISNRLDSMTHRIKAIEDKLEAALGREPPVHLL